MGTPDGSFRLQDTPLDVEALRGAMSHPGCGALVSFEGRVRDHNEGRTVERLEYESYPELALKEGQRIAAEACRRFGVERVVCVHRTGLLEIGEAAVWVGVASGHRGESFEACRWVIDQVKHSVPVWKREHYVEGEPEWVSCHSCMHALHDHGL